MQLPASSSLLIYTIDGVLNLSSVDKKALTQRLNFTAGNLVDNLGGLSMVGIVGGILLLFVLLIVKFVRLPKLKCVVERIKHFLMWNFCIRYYQVTFVNMLFEVTR
jgi:hypothetical protein